MDGPDTAGREHDEDDVWRDLVSRLDPDVDAHDEDAAQDPPWPAQEDVDPMSFGARVVKPADPAALPVRPAVPHPGEPTAPAGGAQNPDAPDEDNEHYIPPPPPPLPHLDSVTKAAWLALFGGPAYLLAATMAGWTIPAWAAFCGIAAFIGGFITLVVGMSDEGGDGSGPDDGAVV